MDAPLIRRRLALAGLAAAVLSALLLAAPPAAALDPNRLITQYSQRVWGRDRGLPHDGIFALAQTPEGYLWMATRQGLVRFSGESYVVYAPENTPGLRSKVVHTLHCDTDGTLWVGTFEGLARRDSAGGGFTSFGTSAGLPHQSVTSIATAADGAMWVGTKAGLARYPSAKQIGDADVTVTLRGEQIGVLRAGAGGSVWAGTEDGLAQVSAAGAVRRYRRDDGLPGDWVGALAFDKDGALWVGTERGVVRLAGERFVPMPASAGPLSGDIVTSLYCDPDGVLWIGTQTGGINRYHDGLVRPFAAEHGLSDNHVTAILEDREGSLWVATRRGGVNQLRASKLIVYSRTEGISADAVYPILEDREGAMWIGTISGGVERIGTDGSVTHLNTGNGLPHNFVRSLCETRDGALWIGTYGGGLVRRQPDGTLRIYTTRDGLPTDFIRSLFEDSAGTLWAGTKRGLARFDNDRFALASNASVIVMAQGPSGSLWLGTEGGGLERFSGGGLDLDLEAALTPKEGLSSDVVLALHPDADGSLWVGTSFAGLSLVRGGKVTRIGAQQGLPTDSILRILDDKQGSLWMSTNDGILRVTRDSLEGVVSRKRARIDATLFGTADGMKSEECSGSGQPLGWRSRDGRLWFPTARGAVVVDPARLPRNELPPPVLVESVAADDRIRRPQDGIELRAGTRTLEIHYAALSYFAPEQLRFRYRLVGYDDRWIEAGARRAAFYTNLPPGQYRFDVVAANHDGVWSETPATTSFSILPFFWEQPAFWVLCAIALLLAGLAVHRLRVRGLRARERELEIKVGQRTMQLAAASSEAQAATQAKSAFLASVSHELRTPLNAIIGYSEMLLEGVDGDARRADEANDLNRIREAARQQLGLINDLLDFSKVEAGKMELHLQNVDVERLMQDTAATVRPLVVQRGNRLEISVAPGTGRMVTDATKLGQALLNLLANAAKFTERGSIVFGVERRRHTGGDGGDRILFRVRDTGIGMDPAQIGRLFEPFTQASAETATTYGGTGLGLAITRKLCHLLGGEVTATSALGRGSEFTIDLPAALAPAPDEIAAALGTSGAAVH